MDGLPPYYAQQMLDIHNRYALSENARDLLRAHDDWKTGRITQDDLGRLVRLSPNMRQAIIDTIRKVNNTMKNKPGEQKWCIEIIQACTDMLTALGKCHLEFAMFEGGYPNLLTREETPTAIKAFPFMKLPPEVRENVYGWYLNVNTMGFVGAVTARKQTKCFCPAYTTPPYVNPSTINLALARTSTTVRDELLKFFYRRFSLHFTCGCEMSLRLQTNQLLRTTVRQVKLHWTGPKSDEGFRALARCPRLRGLDIIISKSTTAYLTPRETEMRKFFVSVRPARLPEALGMDELLLIRGIHRLIVSHTNSKLSVRRTEEERSSLLGLLESKLLTSGNDESS